jgi:16S rRNA (cytosine1402-N4)-methyltransferase
VSTCGDITIIFFQSGEDRRMKHAFREGFQSGIYREISEESIMASEMEAKSIPRSRSEKLK